MEWSLQMLKILRTHSAGQQLNIYIPESSDTGCQFLCHVFEWQLLRVCKGVKDMEQQKKEVSAWLLALSIEVRDGGTRRQKRKQSCIHSVNTTVTIIHDNAGVVF